MINQNIVHRTLGYPCYAKKMISSSEFQTQDIRL